MIYIYYYIRKEYIKLGNKPNKGSNNKSFKNKDKSNNKANRIVIIIIIFNKKFI